MKLLMTKRYVARQAIVDREGKPYAYELLYRNSASNCYPAGTNEDTATKDLISALSVDFNTQELTMGHQAFINFPREVLLSEAVNYLDCKAYMLEVLENVEIDDILAERIHNLKKKGYQFAIDDYTGEQDFSRIADDISLIKVDYKDTPIDKQVEIVEEYKCKKLLLCEKVETEAEFQQALHMGYDLFQGYYFARPTLLTKESIGFSQSSVITLLNETHNEDVDFDKIEQIINADVGLTYRLLAKGNTAQFAGKSVFTRPSQVLVRMGIEELQKWATLMLMHESAQEGQEPKMELALLRGLFLQGIGKILMPKLDRQERYYLYLTGMFSIFPPGKRAEIFQSMHFTVSEELESAIAELIDFVYSYELGDYDSVDQFLSAKDLTDGEILACYKTAIAQAGESSSLGK